MKQNIIHMCKLRYYKYCPWRNYNSETSELQMSISLDKEISEKSTWGNKNIQNINSPGSDNFTVYLISLNFWKIDI